MPKLSLIAPHNFENSSIFVGIPNAPYISRCSDPGTMSIQCMYYTKDIVNSICYSTLNQKWKIVDQVYNKTAVNKQLISNVIIR